MRTTIASHAKRVEEIVAQMRNRTRGDAGHTRAYVVGAIRGITGIVRRGDRGHAWAYRETVAYLDALDQVLGGSVR